MRPHTRTCTRPVTNLRRGHSLLLALFGSMLIIGLVTGATLLLRPVGRSLDAHMDLASAQLVADSAIEEALCRMDHGKSPAFVRESESESICVENLTEPEQETRRLEVTVRVRATALGSALHQTGSWAVVRVATDAIRRAGSHVSAGEYVVLERMFAADETR